MQQATTALTQYAATYSAAHYGQAAQRAGRGPGAALTVAPQMAFVASSRAGRGLFNEFLQASDQKVLV